MDNTVLVQNNGSEPVLVGDRYLQPRERRRVLRQPYEIAKSRHDCLALVGEAGQEDDTQAGQREEIEHPGEGEQVTMPAGGDVLPPVKTKRVKPQKKQTSSP